MLPMPRLRMEREREETRQSRDGLSCLLFVYSFRMVANVCSLCVFDVRGSGVEKGGRWLLNQVTDKSGVGGG